MIFELGSNFCGFLNWVRSSIALSVDEKITSPWHWCYKNCLTSQPGKSELMSLSRISFIGLLFLNPQIYGPQIYGNEVRSKPRKPKSYKSSSAISYNG